METFATLLDSLNLVEVVNDHAWVWPVCEIFHFVGMALLIGAVGMLDLRILGFAKGLPIDKLEGLVPIGIIGFAMNAVTGFIFVAGNPAGGALAYFENLSFVLKMVLILIAGLNVIAFYFTGVAQAAHAVGASGDAPGTAKGIAALSLVCWIGVIVFGRLIMYNDTLLLALGL